MLARSNRNCFMLFQVLWDCDSDHFYLCACILQFRNNHQGAKEVESDETRPPDMLVRVLVHYILHNCRFN